MYGIQFYRPARAYPERLPEGDFLLAPPPTIQSAQQGAASWLQYIFPLVGSLGSLGMIFVFHASLPFIIIAICTALLSVGMGVLMRFQQQGAVKKRQKADRKTYQLVIDQQIAYLNDLAQRQQKVSAYLYPSAPELAASVARRERLWERRFTDADFLRVRLGT